MSSSSYMNNDSHLSKLFKLIFSTSARQTSCCRRSLIFIWIRPFHFDHCQVLGLPVISLSPVSSNSFWRSGLELYFAAFTKNMISTFFCSHSRMTPVSLWPSLQTLFPYMEPVSEGNGTQFSTFPLDSEPSANFCALNWKIRYLRAMQGFYSTHLIALLHWVPGSSLETEGNYLEVVSARRAENPLVSSRVRQETRSSHPSLSVAAAVEYLCCLKALCRVSGEPGLSCEVSCVTHSQQEHDQCSRRTLYQHFSPTSRDWTQLSGGFYRVAKWNVLTRFSNITCNEARHQLFRIEVI